MTVKKYNPKGIPVAPRQTEPNPPEKEGKHQGLFRIGPKEEQDPIPGLPK